MSFIIGIDIGTSGVRSVVYDDQLQPVCSRTVEYPTYCPRPGYAEQDPDMIVARLLEVVSISVKEAGALGSDIKAVAFSCVMHSMIALDRYGRRITPAYIWSDLRSAPYADQLKKEVDQNTVYKLTGCPIHPVYLTAKILWFKHSLKQEFNNVGMFMSIKDYVLYKLTGKPMADSSVASASGLLNIHDLKWEDSILDVLGIDQGLLPPVVSPLTVVDGLTSDMAQKMGIPQTTPLVIGAADGCLSNIGAGALRSGAMALMVGTSAAVRTVSSEPRIHSNASTWCYHLVGETWIPGGAVNNGGNILRWFRDEFGAWEREKAKAEGKNVYDTYSEYARKAPVGSEGLIFLAFLAGERCPWWNSDARGALFGLSLKHGKEELVRAIMEGVAYQLYSVYKELASLCGHPTAVHATGGFTNSDVWLQVMADVFGVPLTVLEVDQGSAFGAAALGALAVEHIECLDDAMDNLEIRKVVEPEAKSHNTYQELYEQYVALYEALLPSFTWISAFQGRTGEELQ